jgi:hypothetical protein
MPSHPVSASGPSKGITFGTVVHAVLENMQQDTTTMTSVHAHRVRRAAMDAMRSLHSEEKLWTEYDGHFQSTAGHYEYDLADELSKLISHPLKVWYTDSETASLNPYDDDGVCRDSHDRVVREARDASSNQGSFERWAWFRGNLYVNAPLDGTVYLYVKCVIKPKIFSYKHDGSNWVYASEADGGGETSHGAGTGVDSQTDTSGWLQNALQLVVAQTTRDLYLGAYQASDPKKSLAETWIARRNEEMDRLGVEREREIGKVYLEPYLMPGD